MEKLYIAPQIETIEIDNEISVVMMSEPPVSNEESAALKPDLNPNKEDHFVA